MKTIAIIGLGYVGLPLAYHLAKKGNNLIGFDISEQKLSELKNGFDATEEIWNKIAEVNIHYTNNPEDLKEADRNCTNSSWSRQQSRLYPIDQSIDNDR